MRKLDFVPRHPGLPIPSDLRQYLASIPENRRHHIFLRRNRRQRLFRKYRFQPVQAVLHDSQPGVLLKEVFKGRKNIQQKEHDAHKAGGVQLPFFAKPYSKYKGRRSSQRIDDLQRSLPGRMLPLEGQVGLAAPRKAFPQLARALAGKPKALRDPQPLRVLDHGTSQVLNGQLPCCRVSHRLAVHRIGDQNRSQHRAEGCRSQNRVKSVQKRRQYHLRKEITHHFRHDVHAVFFNKDHVCRQNGADSPQVVRRKIAHGKPSKVGGKFFALLREHFIAGGRLEAV